MKSIAKNSFYYMFYTFLNILFPLISSMYVSRVLFATGIGKVTEAQTFASYFTTLASLGLPIYGVRIIATLNDDKEKLSCSFAELFLINSILSLLSLGLYLIVIMFDPLFNNDLPLYFTCGLNVILNIINVDWFYQGKEEYKYIAIRSVIVKIVSLILILIFVKTQDDYLVYAFISNVALAGNYIFNVINLRKYINVSIKNLNIKKHIKSIILLSGAVIFASIYNKIDITMLGILCNDETVGIYSNAHKSLNIVLSATTAITAVLFPRLSSLYNSNMEEFHNLVYKGADTLLYFSIPAFMGVFVLSPFLIDTLYGVAFSDAAITLRVFSPLIIINSLGSLYAYQIIMAVGEERKRFAINVIGCITNIVINYILIPLLADYGAAIASVISELFIFVTMFVYVSKKYHFRFPIKELLKILSSSIVMGVVVFLVTMINLSSFTICLCGIIIGVLVYFFVSLLFKVDFCFELLNRIKRMIRRQDKVK